MNDYIRSLVKEEDITFTAIRSSGAGGQHANKVSTAIVGRFDIKKSSLPEEVRSKLLQWKDRHITSDGIILIKASRHRSQLRNRKEVLTRVEAIFRSALTPKKKRRPTKPSKKSKKERIDSKRKRGDLKKMRKKIF